MHLTSEGQGQVFASVQPPDLGPLPVFYPTYSKFRFETLLGLFMFEPCQHILDRQEKQQRLHSCPESLSPSKGLGQDSGPSPRMGNCLRLLWGWRREALTRENFASQLGTWRTLHGQR